MMVVEGEEHRVAEGDAFRLEPKERHDIRNDTKVPVQLLFIKAPWLPEDKVNCVVGEAPGSKREEGQRLGTAIIDERALMAMAQGG